MDRPVEAGPPAAALWAVNFFIRGAGSEYLLGDLEEEFRRRAGREGSAASRRWYTRQVLASVAAWWSPFNQMARWRLRKRRGSGEASAARRTEGWVTLLRPALGAVVVVAVALGVGVGGAILSRGDGSRPLVTQSKQVDRLVFVHAIDRHGERYQQFTFPEVEALRAQATALADLAGYSLAQRTVTGEGIDAFQIRVARVSEGFFAAVDVPVHLGRGFAAEEHAEGADVVLLSYRLWSSAFDHDTSVIGSTIEIQGVSLEVVGVLPERFAFPSEAEIWRPASRWLRQDNDREVSVLARLSPEVTVGEASAQVADLIGRMRIARYSPAGVHSAWVEVVAPRSRVAI